MRPNYASSRDMTGNSYGSDVVLYKDKVREQLCEIMLDREKEQAMDAIVEIDRQIFSGNLSDSRIARLEKKREIKFAIVAKCENGKAA